jgi:hypothetical protein
VRDEVVEADAVEEPAGTDEGSEQPSEVRALEGRGGSELDAWRGEMRTVAMAAAGGIAAGAVTVVAMSAVRSRSPRRQSKRAVLGRKGREVVASRSFLVDVHVLGR